MENEFLKPVEEITYQCWVRYSHLPEEWHQIGGRKSEYSSVNKFKAALQAGNTSNPIDNPERYAEVIWVKCTKTVVKEIAE